MICRLFGGQLLAEVPTQLRPAPRKACGYEGQAHMGFIDLQLESSTRRYIIEMKKDRSPSAALKKIEAKGYHLASTIETTKPIELVGISFYKTAKGVKVKWKSKGV